MRNPGYSVARVGIPQRLTGFSCAVDEVGRVLMLRHERLGVLRWELPGGHVDPGETVCAAVARETREEALTDVEVGPRIAECWHTWRGRRVGVLFFLARPMVRPGSEAVVRRPGDLEEAVHDVRWMHVDELSREETSPLAWPVLQLLRSQRTGGPSGVLMFEATHTRTQAGWEPIVTRIWHRIASCRGSSAAEPVVEQPNDRPGAV